MSDLTTFIGVPNYPGFIDSLFMREAHSADLRSLRGATWTSAASGLDCGLEVLGSASYDFSGADVVLVRVGSGIAQIIQRERAITVRIASESEAAAGEIEQALRALIPPTHGAVDTGEVEVRFWWAAPDGRNHQVTRTLTAPAWGTSSTDYSFEARTQLAALSSLQPPLSGGRLLLFHGPPGTGKTNSMLSLAEAWRAWLDTEIISDPRRSSDHRPTSSTLSPGVVKRGTRRTAGR